MEQFKVNEDTIAAISTPNGTGGIAVIRISGPDSLSIVDSAWKGKSLRESSTHTAHLGRYYTTSGDLLDECVATLFRAPATFTGEDVVELSVHGSRWIQRELLSDLIRRGVRVAAPGEFTRRAYMNGRLDLAQAEGVADLISASSRASHSLALSQTRGHFSKALDSLRMQLIDFASLLELELDFSEEDVEFADREKMLALSQKILKEVARLSKSYSAGAVLKEGIPVVIAGIPNAGKSSLLNLLLNDDKAIVSDIPGTTRDIIEDTLELDGYLYRFIDTAGLRESADKVESIGIERAKERMRTAKIVIWLYDPTAPLQPQQQELQNLLTDNPDSSIIILRNKSDLPVSSSTADTLAPSTLETAAPAALETNSSDSLRTNVNASTETEATVALEADLLTSLETATLSLETGTQSLETATPSLETGTHSSLETDAYVSFETAAHSLETATPSLETGTQSLETGAYVSFETATPSHETDDLKSSIHSSAHNEFIRFSTKTGEGLDKLKDRLKEISDSNFQSDSEIIVTNARHYEALIKGGEAIQRAIEGIESGISGDFIAQDVREALHYLGTITGAITTPTLLQSIFSRFCIGK